MPTDNKRLRCKKPDCRRQFTRQQGSNRLYCYECRPERTKQPNWAEIRSFPAKSGENGEENGQIEGNVTRLSRITLEKAGVLETWQGGAVMALAQHIDDGKGGGGGGSAGVAGAIRAHAEAMARAMEIAETEEVDNVSSIFESKA